MADYIFDIAGSSNSAGVALEAYGLPLLGGSRSGGLLNTDKAILLVGSSQGVGELDGLPFAGGRSNSGGFLDIVYQPVTPGQSQSSGRDALSRGIVFSGGSTSSGTLDYLRIAALVDLACYILNTETKRTYQFANYGFLGVGRFNGKLLGVKDGKIYDLETAATKDGTTNIAASLEFTTDLGMPNHKGLRSLYIEDSEAKITLIDENGKTFAYRITPREFRSLPRNMVSRVFTIRVENEEGKAVTLRRIHGKVNILNMKGA